MADLGKQNTSGHFINSNPIIRKLSKIQETDSEYCCSYAGIARKLVFFLLVTATGVAISLVLKLAGTLSTGDPLFSDVLYKDGQVVTIYSHEVIALAISGIIMLICPMLAVFIRPTIPVTGSLFCAATGYFLAWLAGTFADRYLGPVVLALVITLVLVFAMGFLYGTGRVKVTEKFKSVLLIALIAAAVSSLLVFIGSLIPATRGITAQIMSNPLLSIGGGILMVILGTMFLLVDFDTIKQCVDGQLPKKYEWYASFGLAFSVIWLYFKVLDLLLRILNRSR